MKTPIDDPIRATATELEKALSLPMFQARSREKMERMLDAGESLIIEHGYEGMKVSEVVNRARCNPHTFYQRFHDKEAFLAMIQVRVTMRVREQLEHEQFFQQLSELPIEEIFERIVTRLIRSYTIGEPLIREFVKRAPNNEGIRRLLIAWRQYIKSRAIDALRPRFDEFTHPDPEIAIDLTIEAFFGMLNNFVIYGTGPFPMQSPELREEMMRLFRSYVGIRRKDKS